MNSDQQTVPGPKRNQPSLRDQFREMAINIWRRRTSVIASFSVAAILLHLILRFGLHARGAEIPLLATLALGGTPLVYELLRKLFRREFGSDLLAGISIVTSVLLGEYLAGSIVVLMLAGGEALETYALRSASSVLRTLAKRMPSLAHRKQGSEILDVALDTIAVGDTLVVYPHDICPVDGVVIEGHGVMDESFLTGEPFKITKTSGSTVISGAINGESAPYHPNDQASRRFALRENHGSHARIRGKAPAAASGSGINWGPFTLLWRLRWRFSLGRLVVKPFGSWRSW